MSSTQPTVPDQTDTASHVEALHRANEATAALTPTVSERWYPQLHVAAVAGWINDPNGLCHYAGRHHVFFQHHPYDAKWGPMHWGHASSADLVTWRHDPVALAPSLPDDINGIWSGSAIVGPDGRLNVFYTGNRWKGGVDGTGVVQTQCRAVSDDGITFTKLGPVVRAPEGIEDFRDPKVWLQDGTYRMIVGVRSADNRGEVWMYTSSDLVSWDFEQVVHRDPRPDVFMLECPDLFPLGEHWVLVHGPMSSARPSGFQQRNAHNAGYVVGDWTPGEAFVPLTEFTHADWGHNNYATQTMLVPDGRRLAVSWMGGFVLPMAPQASDGWGGQMTLVRELSLDDDLRLVQRPTSEFEQLRERTDDLGSFSLAPDETRLIAPDADLVDIELEIDLANSSAEEVALLVHRTDESHFTSVSYDDQAGRIVLDRGLAPATDRGRRSAPYPGGERLRLRVVVDRGSVEVFVNGGVTSVSSLSYPQDGPRSIALTGVAGTVEVTSLRVHHLRSIWQ